jgi:hypothetical protein
MIAHKCRHKDPSGGKLYNTLINLLTHIAKMSLIYPNHNVLKGKNHYTNKG